MADKEIWSGEDLKTIIGEIIVRDDFKGLPKEEQKKFIGKMIPPMLNLPPIEQDRFMGKLGIPGFEIQQAPAPMPPTAQGLTMGGRPVFEPPSDPMSASLGSFQPPFMPEPETVAGMAAGAAGPAAVTAPLTGMATAAAGTIQRAAQGKADTFRPEQLALMEAGLPAVSDEQYRAMGLGMTADVTGRGVVKLASKLLFPAGRALKSGTGEIIEWARQKGIPIPTDITKTFMGKAAENLPDIGMAGSLVQLRREKTAQGLTDAVKQIADDVGLPWKPPGEVGQDIGQTLLGMVSGSPEYTAFQAALKSMDPAKRFAVPNLQSAIMAIGRKGAVEGKLADDIALKSGMEAIERVYGNTAPRFYEAIKDIVENNFMANSKNLADIDALIWQGLSKKGYSKAAETSKNLAERLRGGGDKTGYLDDLADIMSPTGQTLGTLQAAKNEAYKDAMRVIDEVNPSLKLLYKPQGQRRFQLTSMESNFENAVDRIFRPGFEKQANQLKQTLTNIGQEDVWETAKMAWIKKSFDDATFKKGEQVYFSPTKYKEWFDANKSYIERMMPEQLRGLQKWYGISDAFEADIKRMASGKGRLALGTSMSGLGGLISYSTGGIGGVAVPQAISFISALSVMPYTGLVRMWLTKASGEVAAPLMGQAVKGGMLEMMGEE